MITRVLIAGAGVIARTHAEAVQGLPGKPGLAAADPDPVARASFLERFPGAVLYESVEAMLASLSTGSEFVVVATPPWLHHPHALAALRSGRHVLCEKPFAINEDQACEIIEQAQRLSLHVACCSLRYLRRPVLQRVQTLLAEGTLGTPLHVAWHALLRRSRPGIEYQPVSRWFLDKNRAGGGCVFDWGPYDIGTFSTLFAPTRVTVKAAWISRVERGPALPAGLPFNVEHHVSATLVLENGSDAPVHIDYERTAHGFGPGSERHQVEGPNGAVTWDWLEWKGHAVHLHADRNGEDSVVTTHHPDLQSGNLEPVQTFATFLNGGPDNTLRDFRMLFNFRVLCAIYEAARTGSPHVVELTG